jgi:tRNA wybutosine-synthesizing protein 1
VFQGVTYCGESKASSLTMANVPWHEEVVHFVQQLVDRLPDYELASEHEHSNCLLLAHKKVFIMSLCRYCHSEYSETCE